MGSEWQWWLASACTQSGNEWLVATTANVLGAPACSETGSLGTMAVVARLSKYVGDAQLLVATAPTGPWTAPSTTRHRALGG